MSAPTLILATPEQIVEFVRGAVQEALSELREDVAPALLDRAGLARALGLGVSTVDRLRREGMPCVFIGDSPRFIASECLGWLRSNRRSESAASG